MKTNNELTIRNAEKSDAPLILSFIKEIADYEKLSHEVTATEKDIQENLFGDTKYAEVLIAESENEPVGYALFFYNFSTFTGRPGIYLEDLFIRPKYRGKGIGKTLLLRLIKLLKTKIVVVLSGVF